MTTYRADLTGDHHRLIAYLLPGNHLILTWLAGEKTINADLNLPWPVRYLVENGADT